MYEYRNLTPEQRLELVKQRLKLGYPAHSPPHLVQDDTLYLLTATCFNHAAIMQSPDRRNELLNHLYEQFLLNEIEIHAWVVLPNHYHILAHMAKFDLLSKAFGHIHGHTSHSWNIEDVCQGRKVWFRYTDRMIRSERHYYTTLNYIHYNPVKHSWIASPYDWKASSLQWYLEHKGREWLRDLWSAYPVRDYGRGWDDFVTDGSAKALTTNST
jgi:putative transposase